MIPHVSKKFASFAYCKIFFMNGSLKTLIMQQLLQNTKFTQESGSNY